MQKCPKCESPRIHRSRAKTRAEEIWKCVNFKHCIAVMRAAGGAGAKRRRSPRSCGFQGNRRQESDARRSPFGV